MYCLLYDSACYSEQINCGERTVLWAINTNGEPMCINVQGYPAEAWLELPPIAQGKVVDWTLTNTTDPLESRISKIIRTKLESILATFVSGDSGNVEFHEKFKMLGYHERPAAYYRVTCEKRADLDKVIKNSNALLTNFFDGVPPVWRETEIDPTTKLFVGKKWERSGLIHIPSKESYKRISEPLLEVDYLTITEPMIWIDEKSKRPVIHIYLNHELISSVQEDEQPMAAKAAPYILYFDFEALSGKLHGFPNENLPSDIIYMASLVFAKLGSTTLQKYCIVVGDPDRSRLQEVQVIAVESEQDLYVKMAEIISYENPDVISGYNIHGFDFKYMETRLALAGKKFPNISRLPGKISEFDFLKGPRGARYTNLKCPGRIVVDLFLYLVKNVSRQTLPSFSLKKVSKYYLKNESEEKIDLGYIKQFELYFRYLVGAPDGPAGLGQIAEYCIRDSEVLPKLFVASSVWPTCVQFSNELGSSIQSIAVAGLVEKLTPFLFANVREANTIMEINPDAGNANFPGGYVHLTQRGLHDFVTIGDFSSLYPSRMIELNLCWTTRVMEEDTSSVLEKYGKDGCHITRLEYKIREKNQVKHVENDVDEASESEEEMSEEEPTESQIASSIRKAKRAMERPEKFSSRDVQVMYLSSTVKEGIIPKALKRLLAKRKHIRKNIIPNLKSQLKALGNVETDEAFFLRQKIEDADKRQEVMKLCANSIYGMMGAAAPYADPFIAMTTTAEGRIAINLTTKVILEADPRRSHIYTDTDSSMIKDPSFIPMKILTEEITLTLDLTDLPEWCANELKTLFDEWAKSRTAIEQKCVIGVVEHKAKGICQYVNNYKNPENGKSLFGPPMSFEYEAFVIRGIWVAKKFYAALTIDENGDIKIKQRGVLLRRSDYPQIVKKIYGDMLFGLLRGKTPYEALRMIADGVTRILTGPELEFSECAISSDFKSISEYKEASCKMAVLAMRAAEAGIPLQNNSRIDYVMLAPPNQTLCSDSSLMETGSKSSRLATLDMYNISKGSIDRDHYLEVLISHVDKIFECILAKPDKSELFVYIDGSGSGFTTRRIGTDQQKNLIEWNLSAPLRSFRTIYKLHLKNYPNENIYIVRSFICQMFYGIIEIARNDM